ncbi:MAG: hypothetical protein IPP51_04890 [Bacteroidetes bacterium]|nr:hypothetical protein [Bacteroidota bacterium]
MKSFIRISMLFLLVFAGMQMSVQKASAQTYVSFQVFYDDLSPYGDWIETPNYGYVWVPNVAPGFSPYGTNGYWVYTEYGWTWVSTYAWGWAPFHYGRWYTDPMYGPIWVPGNVWGPGWVTWRHCDGYYGWAPIEPGIEINIAYSNSYHGPRDQWRFVRDRDFGRRDINKYYVHSSRNPELMQKSTALNNPRIDNTSRATYNTGPDRNEVQKFTGTKFNPVRVRENDKPGQRIDKGELQIYRPRVEQNNAGAARPVPPRVENIKDVNPAAQRNPQSKDVQRPQPQKNQPKAEPNQAKPSQSKPDRSVPQKANPTKPARRDEPVILKPLRIDPVPNKTPPAKPAPKREAPAKPQSQPAHVSPTNPRNQTTPRVQPPQQQQTPSRVQPTPRRPQPVLPPNHGPVPGKVKGGEPRKK